MNEEALQIVFARTLAMSAGALAFALMAIGSVSAQIVPETSGQPSAANSPAAAVQTGSRKRLTCTGCPRPEPTLVEAWLDEVAAGLAPKQPVQLR